MRILVLTNLYPPIYLGGYELGCQQVCEELVQRGHTVTALTSNYKASQAQEVSKNVDVRRQLQLAPDFGQPADLGKSALARIARSNSDILLQALNETKPDVLFAWSQLRLTAGPLRAAHAAKIPIVLRICDETIRGLLPSQRWLSLRRLFFPQLSVQGVAFAAVSVISERIRSRLVDLGMDLSHAELIRATFPLGPFSPKPHPGSLQSPPRILYVGQLEEYKGVHTIIEGVEHCSRHMGTPLNLTIVGAGDREYTKKLHELAAGSTSSRVTFTGKIPYAEIAKVYQTHDTLIFASTDVEGQGLTHLEALACGVPVIATNCGGQAEVLVDGETGLLFPEGNVDLLASQLQRLLTDADLRQRLAASGLQMVHREFSFDLHVDRLEKQLLLYPSHLENRLYAAPKSRG